MNEQAQQYVEDFMARLIARNPGEPEFHQAVREVAESLAPHIVTSPILQKMKVLERIAEPIYSNGSHGYGGCFPSAYS